MENLRRLSQYFRSPLVVCGTVQTLWVPHPYSGVEDLPDAFYKLFGRPWGHISTFKQALNAEMFMIESAVEAFDHRHVEELPGVPGPVEATKQKLFHMLCLPSVPEYAEQFSDTAARLLEESKRVVPFILDPPMDRLEESLREEHGFVQQGSASGPGFTCAIYRKQSSSIPVYIIAGELDMSADTFYALAKDVGFRHKWDDQFHHAQAEPIDAETSLVEWVVKWPWPLAPREYKYVLSSHELADGTRLVMASSVPSAQPVHKQAVSVREYFGITASKPVSEHKCRFCVYYYDDPRLPGRMPAWLESYVTQQLLPAFPRKVLIGAGLYAQRTSL